MDKPYPPYTWRPSPNLGFEIKEASGLYAMRWYDIRIDETVIVDNLSKAELKAKIQDFYAALAASICRAVDEGKL